MDGFTMDSDGAEKENMNTEAAALQLLCFLRRAASDDDFLWKLQQQIVARSIGWSLWTQ